MKKCVLLLLALCFWACTACNTESGGNITDKNDFEEIIADSPENGKDAAGADLSGETDTIPSGTEADATENEEGVTVTPETDETDKDQTEKEEKLNFVDAHGNWHETIINPNVPAHHYNWDALIHDDTGISYEDENYFIRKGIDVSHHQGDIDWEKVKASGYDFAIIRIGYRGYGKTGSLNQDRMFYTNIQGAKAAGLDVGVYFFAQAINEKEALEEADFVLDMLKGYSLQLPITYDPELIYNDDARTDNVTGEQFTKNTIAFCERIKAAGFEPMVYSNMIWEADLFDMEQLQAYPFWYADYEKVPQTPYDFCFWQYTEKGNVDGIKGNVDLNIQFIEK